MAVTVNYQVILPIFFVSVTVAITITVWVVVAANRPADLTSVLVEQSTTTSLPTTNEATTTPPATSPPLTAVPSCSGAVRSAVNYNHTLTLSDGSVFSYNILIGDVTQSFLNDTQIMTDPIVAAVRDGERYLVSQLNSNRLSSVSLTGSSLQDLFIWQFDNVHGLITSNGYVYVLTDTNELLRMFVGSTYALISQRLEVSHPVKYLTKHPDTGIPYVLFQNGTIGTLQLNTGTVQAVCNPAESGYRNLAFNAANQLLGSVELAVDLITV